MPYGDMEPTGMQIWIERAHSSEPAPRTTDAISTEEPRPTRAPANDCAKPRSSGPLSRFREAG